MKDTMKPTPSQKPGLKLVTVRMPVELHAEISEIADKQRRSMNSQLVYVIAEHIEREKAAA